MPEQIYTLPEELIKREVKIINQGELAPVAYVNNRPIYLQQDKGYSWDKEGRKSVNDFLAFDITHFFMISLEPTSSWRIQ